MGCTPALSSSKLWDANTMNWFVRCLKRSQRGYPPFPLTAIFRAAHCAIFLLVGVCISLWCPSNLFAENGVEDQVIYIKSGGDSFAATLVPDHSPGSVPNDSTLVEATTNGEPTAFQLVPGSEGQIDLGGKLPGLEDGRHRGAIKTLTPDGDQKDRKALLFIVDSKPPLIEQVEPEGDFFPRSAGAIRFRITDPENGSGVSIDPAECALNVAVSGATLQNRILSFRENELDLTVFVAFPGGAAAHDADFTVSVSLQDRAGNVGRTSKTFTIRSLVSPYLRSINAVTRTPILKPAANSWWNPHTALWLCVSGGIGSLMCSCVAVLERIIIIPITFVR